MSTLVAGAVFAIIEAIHRHPIFLLPALAGRFRPFGVTPNFSYCFLRYVPRGVLLVDWGLRGECIFLGEFGLLLLFCKALFNSGATFLPNLPLFNEHVQIICSSTRARSLSHSSTLPTNGLVLAKRL